MYALVDVCYLERNKQLPICSPGSPLALTTLAPLASLTLPGTHVVPHDNVMKQLKNINKDKENLLNI